MACSRRITSSATVSHMTNAPAWRGPRSRRRAVRALLAVCALCCVASATASAQVPQLDDTTLLPQTLKATTERLTATHISTLATNYALSGDRVAGRLRARLTSTTTLLDAFSTKDQVDADMDVEYRVPRPMRLFMISTGTLTTDARREGQIPGLNNTANIFIGVGGRVVDSAENRVGLAVGGVYDRQLNEQDVGSGVYGEAKGHLDLAGYHLYLDGTGHWHNISPRHNSNVSIDTRMERAFEEGGAMQIQGRYELFGTELYLKRNEDTVVNYGGLAYDGVQRRSESRLFIGSQLSYPLAEALGLDVSLSLGDQRVGHGELSEGLPPLPEIPDPYQYLRRDLSIGATIEMYWSPDDADVRLNLEYSTNEEYNTVNADSTVSPTDLAGKRQTNAQNDYITRQVLLGGHVEYRPSRADTVAAFGSISIFRYDTPSPLNYFDRDEQSIQAQLRYARVFSPYMNFVIYAQAFLTHQVYLSGRNSNDNNWNRVFRLSPSVNYSPGAWFTNSTSAEVLANYTEYDFEGRTQNIRGRSFRELRLRDSMEAVIAGTLRLRAKGDLRIAERGSFSWGQFAESPLERTRTEGVEAELLSSLLRNTTFGVGARLSRIKSFRTDPRTLEMVPFSDRTSFGPTARIETQISSETDVQLSGWWEHRFEESRLVSRVPSLFLTVEMKL